MANFFVIRAGSGKGRASGIRGREPVAIDLVDPRAGRVVAPAGGACWVNLCLGVFEPGGITFAIPEPVTGCRGPPR
jgi:hypothetical protein